MDHVIRISKILVISGVLASTGLASPALAGRLNYDFRVTNLTGELSGQEFFGSFSFDHSAFTGMGSEFIERDNGMLEFDFEFLGDHFDELDYSRTGVLFEDGEFSNIVFISDSEPGTITEFFLRFSIVPDENSPGGREPFSYSFDDEPGSLYQGDGRGDVVVEFQGKSGGIPVPEPSITLGLVGIGATMALRKSLKNSKSGVWD